MSPERGGSAWEWNTHLQLLQPVLTLGRLALRCLRGFSTFSFAGLPADSIARSALHRSKAMAVTILVRAVVFAIKALFVSRSVPSGV
jgi:hypothetical protein